MELVLSARHEVAGDSEENQLIDEGLLQVYLDVLVGQYSLAFNKQRANLWLSDDIPPVFTVLNDILNHLIIVTFKFVILLIAK